MPILPKILIATADFTWEHRENFAGTLSFKEVAMKAKSGWHMLLIAGLLVSATSIGCLQTTVGGQTLPSPHYLDDDVQYFPKGPEQKLSRQIRALEQYKTDRQSAQQGLNENSGN